MKTTKKGFTLIELIVVIAIIGVLAAILVPAMLGYVKKSKIQSANSAASTMLKACNSAIEELDEEDVVVADGTVGHERSATTGASTSASTNAADVLKYMKEYSDDVASSYWKCDIQHGVAIACAAQSGKYFGTSPQIWSNKNYGKKVNASTGKATGDEIGTVTLDNALTEAVAKYDFQHPSDTTTEES